MSSKKKALEYAKQGWQVLPVSPRGKVPMTAHGLNDASVKRAQIEQWFQAWPDMNVGVRTGQESGIVVLDVDPKPSLRAALRVLADAGFDIPKTMTVETGSGGRHFYFEHPGVRVKTMVGLVPGVDVRGDGGYVVAAPSRHESGSRYKIIDARKPAKCPEWLVKALAAPKEQPAKGTGTATGLVVASGGRNQYLTQLAGAMRRRGASFETLLAAVEAENKSRCTPPLSGKDCFKIAKSVERYAIEDAGSAAVEISSDNYVQGQDLVPAMQAFLSNDTRKLGCSTGIDYLDKMLGGGKRLGEITGWSALAKAGKSSWLHQMIHESITHKTGEKIGYASREMSPAEEVLPNLLSIASGTNVWLKGAPKQLLKTYPLKRVFFSQGYGYFPIEEFKSWALSLHEHEGVRLFMLDHLLYSMQDPEDYKEVSRWCRDVKAFVKEHNFHLDLIIQPYKLQQGERIGMNSLRGGAAIAQALDNLFCLERVEGHRDVTKVWLELGRSKLCEVGAEVFLKYDRATTRFSEVEPVGAEDKRPIRQYEEE